MFPNSEWKVNDQGVFMIVYSPEIAAVLKSQNETEEQPEVEAVVDVMPVVETRDDTYSTASYWEEVRRTQLLTFPTKVESMTYSYSGNTTRRLREPPRSRTRFLKTRRRVHPNHPSCSPSLVMTLVRLNYQPPSITLARHQAVTAVFSKIMKLVNCPLKHTIIWLIS